MIGKTNQFVMIIVLFAVVTKRILRCKLINCCFTGKCNDLNAYNSWRCVLHETVIVSDLPGLITFICERSVKIKLIYTDMIQYAVCC